jgi:hypothetical protein
MKLKLLFTALVLLLVQAASLYADALTPSSSVEQTIRHAHDGIIVGADLPSLRKTSRHAWNEKSLLEALDKIDPEKIVFQASNKPKGLFWFPLADNKVLVRMLEPRRLDFELTFVADKASRYGGSYVITAINP